jgi:hypothetical protein
LLSTEILRLRAQNDTFFLVVHSGIEIDFVAERARAALSVGRR